MSSDAEEAIRHFFHQQLVGQQRDGVVHPQAQQLTQVSHMWRVVVGQGKSRDEIFGEEDPQSVADDLRVRGFRRMPDGVGEQPGPQDRPFREVNSRAAPSGGAARVRW